MNREKLYIFLDDERDKDFEVQAQNFLKMGYSCMHCYTAEKTLKILTDLKNSTNFIVDFDNDLGEELEGYDVAKFIVENEIALDAFRVHSMNSVGRANIRQLLNHYGYKEVF